MNDKVMKYVKKPTVVEAIQWTGTNLSAVIEFTGKHHSVADWSDEKYAELVARDGLKIRTLEGWLHASVGDFIIKGVANEFYPCKPEIFHKTYNYYAYS